MEYSRLHIHKDQVVVVMEKQRQAKNGPLYWIQFIAFSRISILSNMHVCRQLRTAERERESGDSETIFFVCKKKSNDAQMLYACADAENRYRYFVQIIIHDRLLITYL